MDTLGIIVVLLGALLAVIGWIWLIVIGFKQGGILWGILIFFFSWIAGLIFCIMHKTGWTPLILMIIGGILAGIGAVPLTMSQMESMPVNY